MPNSYLRQLVGRQAGSIDSLQLLFLQNISFLQLGFSREKKTCFGAKLLICFKHQQERSLCQFGILIMYTAMEFWVTNIHLCELNSWENKYILMGMIPQVGSKTLSSPVVHRLGIC